MEHLTTVRYWAAIKEAAGTAEEQLTAPTLAALLATLRETHGERFRQVLERCSLLVDGEQVGTRDRTEVVLHGGEVVDCLPPFAGG